jgi:hypothetical protein
MDHYCRSSRIGLIRYFCLHFCARSILATLNWIKKLKFFLHVLKRGIIIIIHTINSVLFKKIVLFRIALHKGLFCFFTDFHPSKMSTPGFHPDWFWELFDWFWFLVPERDSAGERFRTAARVVTGAKVSEGLIVRSPRGPIVIV